MFLLDTNVVSELRRARRHGAVLAWLHRQDDAALWLSAVTLGEIQAGIERTRDQDPARAAELEAWLAQVADTFNILPMDAAAFRATARLMHHRPDRRFEDAMIAATALIRGLVVVPRSIRDFQGFGVSLLDPFAAATESRLPRSPPGSRPGSAR
ncbi:MAG: type II toxin-antitoxin system VapC family toxin [Acetobacteraceae bacterium]